MVIHEKDRNISAFTLAEVLAALVFMAIVIPVAVEALRVANRAGVVGQRKAAASRVAERILNEMLASGQVQGAGQSGSAREGESVYQWTLRTEPWREDAMSMVTVQVHFPVQGLDYDVRLTTLLTNTQ